MEKCKNCGHEENNHYFTDRGCMVGTHKDDFDKLCDCKQFTPSERYEKGKSIPLKRDEKGCGKHWIDMGEFYMEASKLCGKDGLCQSCPNLIKKGRQTGRTNITTEQILELCSNNSPKLVDYDEDKEPDDSNASRNPSKSGSESNLSDKIHQFEDLENWIYAKDVKEFIKKLKEDLKDEEWGISYFETIDKLAGEDLK